MVRVNVIYHHYPHYRRPVLRELVKSGEHEYRFWGSLDDFDGIKTFRGDDLIRINPIRFSVIGKTWMLRDYWPAVLDKTADVLVVHGHPNMPASWLISLAGRLRGKIVMYWAHGWLRPEGRIKSLIRNLHYGLAHHTMTYAERAKNIAVAGGFPADKVVPIYNSLDWLEAKPILSRLESEGIEAVRQRLSIEPTAFRIVCVARLTHKAGFNLLICAMKILKERGRQTELCLIGDGDQRAELVDKARCLDLKVDFLGELYDETTIGEHIYASDLTVSPGKVGLSAMHSMMYGTPVISHGDLDSQMPEVEAVIEGQTGSLFVKDDVVDLADKIDEWMNRSISRSDTRRHCVAVIEARYNPVNQARLINDAISRAVANRTRTRMKNGNEQSRDD